MQLEITQEHIDRAIDSMRVLGRGLCTNCIVAQALMGAGYVGVAVYNEDGSCVKDDTLYWFDLDAAGCLITATSPGMWSTVEPQTIQLEMTEF